MSSFEKRNKEFLSSFCSNEIQLKHEDFTVQIRRKKRNSVALKRRALDLENNEGAPTSLIDSNLSHNYPILSSPDSSFEEKLIEMKRILENETNIDMLIGILTAIRNISSVENAPIMIMSDIGFIQQLLKYVNLRYSQKIVYEAS